MKKTLIIFSVLFLVSNFCNSQNGIGNDFMFQYGTSSTIRVGDLPVKKGETKGTYYIDDEWHNANINLITSETIESYLVKINIREKNIEIKNDNEILLLNFDQVANLEWDNNGAIESFILSEPFINNSELGFAQLLSNGDVKLFSKPTLVLLPSTYNTAMAAGENSDKYVIENKLFIYMNESLIPVKNSKSSVLKVFTDKEDQMASYIKENKIKFKEINDLILVVKYYDSL